MLRRRGLVGLVVMGAVVALSGMAHAQIGLTTDKVRLECRIVSQLGTPDAAEGVLSFDTEVHPDVDGEIGVPRRFELQYRLIDLDANDAFEPRGLLAGQIRLTAVGGTLHRAALSRFEAGNPSAGIPPLPSVAMPVNLNPDTSGPSANGARGLQRPYRGSIPAPAPNNDHPTNGVVEAGGSTISGIVPLVLSAPDQYAPSDSGGGWFALYSFEFTPNSGVASVAVDLDADSQTGNRFAFFAYDLLVPVSSPSVTTDMVTVRTVALGACCTAGTECGVLTAAACAGQSGLYRGDNTTCSPNLCPPPFSCCFPAFVCLVAMNPMDCMAAGGTVKPQSACTPLLCCPGADISAQPQGQYFIIGQTVQLSVAATSAASLGYQWRRDGTPLSDGGRISGSQTAAMTIADVQAGDAGAYDVVITSSCGTVVTSAAASVAACVAPGITSEPSGRTVCAGNTTTFAVNVTGAPEPALQWRRNGMNIAGATGSMFTIDPVTAADAASYDCVVSNLCGMVSTTPATLVVEMVPSIDAQPSPAAACIGSPASFTVAASSVAFPLSYQWRKGGLNISGETAPTLSLASVSPGDAGSYDCVVSNACGGTTSAAAPLTVNAPPEITTDPGPQTVCAGTSAVFAAAATGFGPITYQWRRNGMDLVGTTGAVLTLNAVSPADAGSYDCAVSNPCGTVVTGSALLTVNTAAVVNSGPGSLVRCPGTVATFAVAASGSPSPQFQWRKNGADIPGANLFSYTIPSVAAGDAGTYDCVVSNICGGQTSSSATLSVSTEPEVTAQPSAAAPCVGDLATFSVTATGTAPLAYQWRKNAAPIGGATAPVYTIASVATGDAGTYDCVVSNSCGSVTSSGAGLTISTNPVITVQPTPQVAPVGTPVMLSLSATASGALLYQWRRNGVALSPSGNTPNVTGPVLAFGAAMVGDDGIYDCLVASPCGVVASHAVALTVTCAGAGGGLDCNGNGLCDALELVGMRDITAPSPAGDDRFGWAVATDGARLLVGARSADTPAGADSGAAFMYTLSGGQWTLEAQLLPPAGEIGPTSDYGNQTEVQGQWAVVAARFATVSGVSGAGAVFIFRNTGSGWSFFQKLTEPGAPNGPGPVVSAQFGHGVHLRADRLAVGSFLSNGAAPQSGAAYIYRFNGLNWAREGTLVAPDGASLDGFGIHVSIDDPYAVVGAPYNVSGGVSSGSAYVFFRSVSGWAFQSKLLPRYRENFQTFGELVAVSGDHALVNAPRETVGGQNDAGAVYTYRRTDTRWTVQRRLTPPTPQALELYGYDIALEGDTLAVGGFQREVAGQFGAGSVDVFRRRGNFWTRADRIDSPKPETLGWFGYSLALSGAQLAVGAFRGSALAVPTAGWVRVFDLNALDCGDNGLIDVCEIAGGMAVDADGNGIPDACQLAQCRADYNDSGAVSVQDVFDLLADYFAGNLTADFNDSGTLSVQDLFDFLAVFFAGCA